MFGAVKKLSARLKPKRFTPSESVFPDIDSDGLIRQLDPAGKGAARGAEDLPLSATDGLDQVETEMVELVNEHRRRGLNSYDQHMQVYAQRLARAVDARAKIETEAETARTDFHASAKTWGNHLADLRNTLADRSHEYSAFRLRHGLIDRTARNPWPLILTLGLLFFMIFVEAIMNGYFFAQSNVLGLLGGWSVALVISVVNVGFSMVFGWFGRWIVHRSFFGKLVGLTVILIWLAFATGFNLSVGHFRDMVEGRLWNDAAIAALENLVASPVDLQSIESWLLVGFGALISFFAFLKGFHLDDRYPGYGSVARRLQEAREDYAHEVEKAHDELLEKRDEAKESLELAGAQARDEINEAVDVGYARQGLAGQRDIFLGHCDDVANRLLAIYREANARARTTPAPAHFARTYRYPAIDDGHATEDQRDRARDAVRRIETAVERAVQDIFSAFDKAIGSHATVDEVEAKVSSPAPLPSGPTEAV